MVTDTDTNGDITFAWRLSVMALGKIVADTLEHSTAGSIATNYVVEGSAKAWCNILMAVQLL